MKFDIYTVGVCQNDGHPTQIAGCGMVLVFTDDFERISFRSMNYGLGNSTQNLADIQAIRLALASVRASHRSLPTVLHTNSHYANMVLECFSDDISQSAPEPLIGKDFVVKPTKNVDTIAEMRRWFSYYDEITVIVEDPDDPLANYMTQARDQADIALTTQTRSDSGTLLSLNTDN